MANQAPTEEKILKATETPVEPEAISERPVNPEANEAPEKFAQDVMVNAEHAKSDMETSFDFYDQFHNNPNYQEAAFLQGATETKTVAKEKLNVEFKTFQDSVENVIKTSEPEIKINKAFPIQDQPNIEMPTAEEISVKPEPQPEPLVGSLEANFSNPTPTSEQITKNTTADSKVFEVTNTPETKIDRVGFAAMQQEVVKPIPEIIPEAIPMAKMATPEQIKAAPVPKYNPEVLSNENVNVAEALSERLKSVRQRAEVYRQKLAERNAAQAIPEVKQEAKAEIKQEAKVEVNPEANRDVAGNIKRAFERQRAEREKVVEVPEVKPETKPELTVEQKNWQEAKAAQERTEKVPNKHKGFYNLLRSIPVARSFSGLIDRMEASSAAEKANKLSEKIIKVDVKLARRKLEMETASSPEAKQKLEDKIKKLEGKQETLNKKEAGYIENRDKAVEKTVLRINEKLAPRKERADQIQTNIDNLEAKIQKEKDYQTKMLDEILKIETEAHGKKNRAREFKVLDKEAEKAKVALTKLEAQRDKFKAKHIKEMGIIRRWETDADSFNELKEIDRPLEREANKAQESVNQPGNKTENKVQPAADSKNETQATSTEAPKVAPEGLAEESHEDHIEAAPVNVENNVEKPSTVALDDIIVSWNKLAEDEQKAGDQNMPLIDQEDMTKFAKKRENSALLARVEKMLKPDEQDDLDEKTISPKAFKLFLGEYMKKKDNGKLIPYVEKKMNQLVAEAYQKNNVPDVNVEAVVIPPEKSRAKKTASKTKPK